MSCTCIEDLEKKVFDTVVAEKRFKKKVVSVQISGKTISVNQGCKLRVVTPFNIELEGQRKEPTMLVAWSYCPFCGMKFVVE